MSANQEYIRKVFGLPACPLKKKKLNRKSFVKAMMANGFSRNAAVSARKYYECGKGKYAYPKKDDPKEPFKILWR